MPIIKLTRGFETVVDEDTYAELSAYKWYASGPEGRPARRLRAGPRKLIYMPHHILGLLPWVLRAQGYEVDHIDGDPLNNTKANLRVVTHTENMRNTVRHVARVGVGYDSHHDRWKAYIDEPDMERINVGTFKTEEEAYIAVQQARQEYGFAEN